MERSIYGAAFPSHLPRNAYGKTGFIVPFTIQDVSSDIRRCGGILFYAAGPSAS